MDVRVYATLRPIVGGPIATVDTQPGDSFRQLMDDLLTRWPDLSRELLDKHGELRNNIHIFLNGRDVRYLDGLDMPIPANAEIAIFPPVGGGSARHTAMLYIGALDYFGVPEWLVLKYLINWEELREPDEIVLGPGWRAVKRLSPRKHIDSLPVGAGKFVRP